MLANQVIEKARIRELIPHAGLMCLLDQVTEWDDKRIVCTSETHLNVDNPLRSNQQLPATALIEYGAQAMATHGGLVAMKYAQVIRSGYIASIRNVFIETSGDMSISSAPLYVKAEQQLSADGNMIYNFSVSTDQHRLISGRVTVVAIFDKPET